MAISLGGLALSRARRAVVAELASYDFHHSRIPRCQSEEAHIVQKTLRFSS